MSKQNILSAFSGAYEEQARTLPVTQARKFCSLGILFSMSLFISFPISGLAQESDLAALENKGALLSVEKSAVLKVEKRKIAKKDKEKKDEEKTKKPSEGDSKEDKGKSSSESKTSESKEDSKTEKAKEGKSKKAKETKDDKESKSEKKGDKEKDSKAESVDKKKSGGMFHLGGGKKKDKAEGDEKADSKEANKGQAEKNAKSSEPEDPNRPKYKFDPALISVLKDISKSLKESEAVSKLEDPKQKLVARLAGEALDKALLQGDLVANRIVDNKDKNRLGGSMSAEAWESGIVEVGPELRASLSALWAKKIDGLLTLEIVGDFDGKVEGSENRLGEFIAVISARSTVDKGFDIQSQQDVNFWLGKVFDLKIDCRQSDTAETDNKDVKSFFDNFHVPITPRRQAYLLALREYKDKLAKAEEDKKKQAELSAQQKQVAETLAKTVAEALAKTVGSQVSAGKEGVPENTLVKQDLANSSGGNVVEKKSEGASDLNAAEQVNSEAPLHDATAPNLKVAVSTPAPAAAIAKSSPAPSSVLVEPSRGSRSNWDSPTAPSVIRTPNPGATIIFPGRAVAGQFITVAVVGPKNLAEPYVGLNFNGAQLSTAENGKVVYQIPEDAQPGYSIRIGLTERPEEAGAAIEVLQPLSSPLSQQTPNLESVSPICGGGGTITVTGHNFDGLAERNRVIIDGAYDANVVVASPVQLKAQLPSGLSAGPHSLCVSTAGLRSNPGNFDLVTVDLSPGGPDTPKNELKKLNLRVLGTQNRVRVKLVNQSRDVIKLIKGDEVVLVTPGGTQNQITVPVQRLRWGTYKIDAEVLI